MSAIRNTLLLVLAAGCATSTADKQAEKAAHAGVKVELREVATNYNRSVQHAAREISRGTDDHIIKRRAINWKQFTFSAGQRARLSPNPSLALLDLWVMALQRKEFFTAGEGRAWFGKGQPLAIKTDGAMVAYIEQVSKQVIPADVFDDVKRDVEAFAAEYPIRGMVRQSKSALSGKDSRRKFKWVGRLTAPFTLGVKDTAASIAEVSDSVDEIADVVENLPQLGRWNVELLVLDLQTNPTIVDLRGDVDRANESIASIANTVATLPADVQTQVSKTLDEIDAKQEGLRKTLRETKDVVVEAKGTVDVANETVLNVQATLENLDKTVQTVERTTDSLARAGPALEPAIKETKGLLEVIDRWVPEKDPNAPPPDPNAPDDLENIARTAEALAKVAPDLRASIADIKNVLTGGELPQAVEGTVDRTTSNAADLIDHLTGRMIQLALVVAVVAFAYRVAVARLVKR